MDHSSDSRTVKAYGKALWEYLKTEKTRHDLFDYLRAIMIISAVIYVIRAAVDMIR